MAKVLLSVLIGFFFLGHLLMVYHYPDPFCHASERKDFEGLSWTIAYIFSLTILFLFRYHHYPLDIPYSCYYLSLFAGLLLLIWDFFYYIRKDFLASFIVYSLLLILFVLLLFQTLRYSRAMALVQLPIVLRTLFIYVGECDKLFV